MKLLLCFGTRPEAIKMAPIIHELKLLGIKHIVCVTGQHREMLDGVLKFFKIQPDYDLDLMTKDQSLNILSASILKEFDAIIEKERPEVILVQGDTTTALMASIAAFHRKVPVAHIEAGLRTFNLNSPFPEEANRQLISKIAEFHFTATESGKTNLLKESVSEDKIFITGNTVIDALFLGKSHLDYQKENEEISQLKTVIDIKKKLILVTGHRRENFGKGIEEVCRALVKIVENQSVQIIFPVHFNPSVQIPVAEILSNVPNINLIAPLNYPSFIWLMAEADLIISDSGGIQEEAPSFKKQVIVTRENTERPEGVEKGFAFLTGTSEQKIFDAAMNCLNSPPDLSAIENPFGDGFASQRIIKTLLGKYG
ncbi:non-hydrolyzing UDP-N-acetylglucosamine 2-epimerase [Salinimicrobium sp. WS361]|uniref:non-hydrolyzing UDP-N-acetylglucosamine 2-epimerase n=1 Tax=Salinimicrobium sp. WS361 TaxID=3425123 RepID=UPI003D6F6337